MKKNGFFIFVLICQSFNAACCNAQQNKPDFSNGVIKDARDGQSYKIVEIGDQIWMAENLNYKIKESSCLENEMGKCETEGRVYRFWKTGKENVCPKGWKIPSVEDWNKLFTFGKMKKTCENFVYEDEIGNECDYYVWNTSSAKLNQLGLSGRYAVIGLTYFNRGGLEFDSHYCFSADSSGFFVTDFCCQDVCEDYVRCIKN